MTQSLRGNDSWGLDSRHSLPSNVPVGGGNDSVELDSGFRRNDKSKNIFIDRRDAYPTTRDHVTPVPSNVSFRRSTATEKS
jgi:hypothetical protein